jgi:F-type H+-transporting ATPase subunit delta
VAHFTYPADRIVEKLIESNELDSFLSDLDRFDLLCSGNRRIEDTLMSAHITAAAKQTLIDAVVTPFFGQSFCALMERLLTNGDLPAYAPFAERLREEVRNRTGACFAAVASAVPLSAEQMARISNHLNKICRHRVYAGNVLDRELVGGFVISIEGRRIDLSVRGDLLKIRTAVRSSR